MLEALARGERIDIRGFATFNVRDHAARTALDPNTMERIRAPARRGVRFKVGEPMKRRLSARPE